MNMTRTTYVGNTTHVASICSILRVTQEERSHRARRAHGVAPAYALHDDEQRAFFFSFAGAERGAHRARVGELRAVLLQFRVVQLALRVDEVRLPERPLDARERRVDPVLGPVQAGVEGPEQTRVPARPLRVYSSKPRRGFVQKEKI